MANNFSVCKAAVVLVDKNMTFSINWPKLLIKIIISGKTEIVKIYKVL